MSYTKGSNRSGSSSVKRDQNVGGNQNVGGDLNVVGSAQLGENSDPVSLVRIGAVAVDPGSIATTVRGEVDVAISGVAVGDAVVMNPPSDLEATLVYAGCRAKAADTVTLFLYNKSGGGVDGASKTWTYMFFRKAA